jgi:hypothetical protein
MESTYSITNYKYINREMSIKKGDRRKNPKKQKENQRNGT